MKKLILILLLVASYAYAADFDYDNSGDLTLADAVLLRKAIAELGHCPTGKSCDINGDGAIDTQDYVAFVQMIRSGVNTTVAAAEKEGVIVDANFGEQFKLELKDTAVFKDPDFTLHYASIKEYVCIGNKTCPRAAIVTIQNDSYNIYEGTSKSIPGFSLYLQRLNSKNNTIWEVTKVVSCEGCRYKGVCVGEGEKDRSLGILCQKRLPITLKKDGESCDSASVCENDTCVDSLCGSSPQLDESLVPVQLKKPSVDAPSQVAKPEMNVSKPPVKGFWQTLWDWIKSVI